jgi:hypothetical protein
MAWLTGAKFDVVCYPKTCTEGSVTRRMIIVVRATNLNWDPRKAVTLEMFQTAILLGRKANLFASQPGVWIFLIRFQNVCRGSVIFV